MNLPTSYKLILSAIDEAGRISAIHSINFGCEQSAQQAGQDFLRLHKAAHGTRYLVVPDHHQPAPEVPVYPFPSQLVPE